MNEMYSLTEKSPLICWEICKFPDLAGIFPPIFQCHKIIIHIDFTLFWLIS
jgi:hypothetical protein